MPFVKTHGKILYYAHVPKCGGTSVENYLSERFGTLAMLNRNFQALDPASRWSRTSPQHIDRESLQLILPLEFIDAAFTVVRHPIARAESAYYFQVGVEKSIPAETPFSEWLQDQIARLEADPFALDNHMRPQSDFVPEGAAVFHLEHGLDPIIPWLDSFSGTTDVPRSIGHSNKRSGGGGKSPTPPHGKPSKTDLDLLAEFFAADFERFGYTVENRQPVASKPAMSDDFLEIRDRELARRASMSHRLHKKFQRWLNRP